MAERGVAPACVLRKHTSAPGSRPTQLRGSAHARAGRGKDERGESPGIRRAKSPLFDPGSTVPRPKIAAAERRKACALP